MGTERDTIGRYELLLELGRGGMAVLHLARAVGVGGFSRLFAIKQILPHLAADPPFVDMFLNEGRIAARLSHPNLCAVFELGQERGELFLVMEYLDGVPWEALAAAAPRDASGLRLVAGVLAQACEGLHHAHTFRDVDGTAMPIVHRDVSPQNVFVSADGVCRVLDFGVSKIATDHRRTRTGLLKGKLPYMAPEQLRGEPADARADIWAVGVMLWEALTGARLFDRDTDFLTYEAIVGAAIPSVNAAAPRYPAATDRVIAGALARDPAARYASAHDLADDLQRLTAELGGAATRAQIAQAVASLCGSQLAARRAAIAAAIAQRPAPAATATRADATGGVDARSAATSPDAAATISMAMRRDGIVVAPRRRRRWIAGALGAIAALTAALTIVSLTRASAPATRQATPDEPIAHASSDDSLVHRTARPPAGTRTPSEHGVSDAPTSNRAASGAPGAASADDRGATDATARTGGNRAASDGLAAGNRAAGAATARNADKRAAADGTTMNRAASGAPADDRAAASDALAADNRAPAAGDRTAGAATARAGGNRSATGAPADAAGDRAAGVATARNAGKRAAAAAGDRAAAGAATARTDGDRAAGAPVPAAAPAPASGWYAVDSSPYATIFVDDRKVGETPLDRIPLSAGPHRVRAVLADGRQRSFAIEIGPDRKTSSGTLTW